VDEHDAGVGARKRGNRTGLGYTHADTGTATLIHYLPSEIVEGGDAMAITANWNAMVSLTRNLGRPGIVSMAISAVDSALWDLKARLLDLPLANLLGSVRESVPIYGSGGFTSYSIEQLQEQLRGWVEHGIARVKMKIGRNARFDLERVSAAPHAIGPDAELFVDANGAYSRKQALAQAEKFAELNVNCFEEPVSSDDLTGLRLLRDRVPAVMEISKVVEMIVRKPKKQQERAEEGRIFLSNPSEPTPSSAASVSG
jgi:L-alanine-DL-glutamate epimerase-like enolase superfamily enzyme